MAAASTAVSAIDAHSPAEATAHQFRRMTVPQNTHEEARRAHDYEVSFQAFGQAQARGMGGLVTREGDVAVWAAPGFRVSNGLMSPIWPDDVVAAEARLRTALRLYAPARAAMFVSLGPSTRPAGWLRGRLRELGFRCTYHVPFLHLDLAAWREAAVVVPTAALAASGLEIQLVRDWAMIDDAPRKWLGKTTTPLLRARWLWLQAECLADAPRIWLLIARRRDGQIAGSVMVFRTADIAGIYDMVVSPDFRRQGIGTALMVAACRLAREQGLRCATLSASAQGLGLYERVGFVSAGRWSDYLLNAAGVQRWARAWAAAEGGDPAVAATSQPPAATDPAASLARPRKKLTRPTPQKITPPST